ncbi:MAG: YfhO family protein [Saprospiraceae bacterium]
MNNSSIFQKALPHVVAIVSFLVICCLYFSPQLNGKVIQAGDTESYISSSKEIKDYNERTGDHTLWTNSMFGGMPAYQISGGNTTNALRYVERTSNLFIPRPIGYFFAMMLGFYVMMLLLGVNPWLSLIGAIAFSITTNNLVLFGAGHMTKLRTFAFFGIMFGGIVLAFRKKYLTGGILFALGLGIDLYANHIQMTYYFFLFLGIYGLIEMIRHSQRGEIKSFGKAVLYLGIGGLLAIGSSASSLWTTYEYSKDTMRGAPILTQESSAVETSSNTKGLEWKYAMQYSNGWLDLFSSFIPGVVGGGGGEIISDNSATARYLKKDNGKRRAPLYWGAVGKSYSTGGPIYFGAAMFFLFLLGMLTVKGSIKWGIGAGVLLTMLLSLGDNFEFFNRLFFDYFPLYNKFRTPNSVLAITAFLIPVLGTLAISEIIQGKTSKKELLKSLYIAVGILGGICLFFALMGGSFFDFTYDLRDANYASNPEFMSALKVDRASLMQSDSFRSLGIILAIAGLIWAFLTDKIQQNILLVGIALITIGDLWTVGKRYLGADKFVKKNKIAATRTPRPVDAAILKNSSTDPNFRVHDLSINAFNSASTSYFHKTIGGYHPAKLQRFQDLIERNIQSEDNALRQTLSKASSLDAINSATANLTVFNMLNTKFFIGNPDGAPIPNANALGNAWFVDNVKVVGTANEEINSLRGLNPESTAIVHNEFQDYVSGLNIQKNGSINLTNYEPNHLTYQSNSTSEQIAVFSEVWYGPNKGWQAFIDDQPVDHIRVNYALRGLKIPSGQHKIDFKFAPSSYQMGRMITLIFSLIILGGFLWLLFTSAKTKLEEEDSTEKENKSKTELKKTTSKKKKK